MKADKSTVEALIAGGAFCVASGSMTLLNKAAFSGFGSSIPISMLLVQCGISVVIISIGRALQLTNAGQMHASLFRIWFPMNVFFVLMIITSVLALRDLSIGMVTVIKSLSNVLILCGEALYLKKRQPNLIWVSALFLVISAIIGGATDLNFNQSGYSWQMLNALVTAAYMLQMKVTSTTFRIKSNELGINGPSCELTMVFYNNLLSLPWLLLVAYVCQEGDSLKQACAACSVYDIMVLIASGTVGFAISFTVLWFVSCTSSSSTVGITGALNKILVTFMGLFLFKVKLSICNAISILASLIAASFFSIGQIHKQKLA